MLWVILLVIIVLAIVLSLLLVFTCWRCCKEKNESIKSKTRDSIVSLSFPLPPPVGESDDMDETQYDHSVVRTFRHHELGGSGEGKVEKNEDYVNNVPRRQSKAQQLMEERKQSAESSKEIDRKNGKNFWNDLIPLLLSATLNEMVNVTMIPIEVGDWRLKTRCITVGPRFLFEAPPAYDEITDARANQNGERRRMVSLKMPDLPVRKVGDTQILNFREAPTQSLSSTTMTAILYPVQRTRATGPSTRSLSAEPCSNTLREPSAEPIQERRGSSEVEVAKASDRKVVKSAKEKMKKKR